MVMVIGFGGRFVQQIQAKELKERWIGDMQHIRSSVLSSSYQHDQIIESAILNIQTNGDDTTMTVLYS
jgi:hypothetical protein